MQEQREYAALEVRLHAMERRLQVAVIGWVTSVVLLGMLGIAAVQASSQPGVLRARGIELVDTAGRTLSMLSVASDGTSRLVLGDGAGRPRVTLGVGSNGEVRFVLSDSRERTRVGLGVTSDGTPWVKLFDAQRVTRVGISVGENTGVSVFDAKGVPRVDLRVLGNGFPVLTLFDHKAVPLIGFGEVGDRTSELTFYDSNKRLRLGLGMAPGENPWLVLTGPRGADLFSAP